MKEVLLQFAQPNLIIREIVGKQWVFDDRVKLKCYYCPKYNVNLRCPPNIPDLDYEAILRRCETLLFCYKQVFDGTITDKDRRDSSRTLHKALLRAESVLYEHNHPLALSFIGGSCKLCGCKCPSETCTKPEQARIMLEAIGVDVTLTAANVGLEIVYPPMDYFWRIGVLLW